MCIQLSAIAEVVFAEVYDQWNGVVRVVDAVKLVDTASEKSQMLWKQSLMLPSIYKDRIGLPPSQINIDEEFKGQLLARLTTESQNALASFVESEVFKKAAEANMRQKHLETLNVGIDEMLSNFASEMNGWRRNANVNLIIGLGCAIIGIGVMWQTLVTLTFDVGAAGEAAWRITDLYRFLARFGLVLIIESVAFFFLKLYREDRSMIRYFRNEITNLESRYVALKSALEFGEPGDISKVLQSLSSTERNFLVKKGDRVISEIAYENSDILLEKLVARLPELAAKLKPTAAAH
jgi:hypothetical protein